MARDYMRQAGTASLIVDVQFIDGSTGLPVTTLAHDTANLQVYAKRAGGTKAAIALANATLGAYTSGGFKHDAYGRYELGVPVTVIEPGAEFVDIFGGKSDDANIVMIPVSITLTEYPPFEDNTTAIAEASGNSATFTSPPIARNEENALRRRIFLLIENASGGAWEGDVEGVKALFTRSGVLIEDEETLSPADIVRVGGKLHWVDPGQAYTDAEIGTAITARVPAAEGRREAATVTSIGTAGASVATESVDEIAKAMFKAVHGIGGYGTRPVEAENKVLVTIPGEGTVEVPAQFAEVFRAMVALGAAVA
ncbi:MAG TPA: hypothetical protein DGD08_01885 [Gemmatimonas aurantiaca]|uniref:Uncharacterized protein n=2 Tax=Gemmatimonas aurantiaca TaxID=173480 RepID=C1AAQ7_GEMAT|nr:hypothetical protein [Gemmatimonas aurantiaca]BAH39313.1 hypothetical protein GAU_2271 [Gemmatimonas aurantiaca T-27]HCT55944.1 hypothetical protein [Gemmatimonas aurantiaca]